MIKCEKLWRLFEGKIVRFGNDPRAWGKEKIPPKPAIAGLMKRAGEMWPHVVWLGCVKVEKWAVVEAMPLLHNEKQSP